MKEYDFLLLKSLTQVIEVSIASKLPGICDQNFGAQFGCIEPCGPFKSKIITDYVIVESNQKSIRHADSKQKTYLRGHLVFDLKTLENS